FDAGHFGIERAGVSLAIVELGRNADAVAVGRYGLDGALQHVEQLIEVSLDHGAHRVQAIVQPAAIDHVDSSGDVLAHAFAGSHRRDAEFEQCHVPSLRAGRAPDPAVGRTAGNYCPIVSQVTMHLVTLSAASCCTK